MLLNRIVAGCMLIIVMLQSFSNIVFVTDYYINTTAYSENCINKNEPQLNCNGHCQLEKKVGEETSKDQSVPERKSELNSILISSKSFFTALPACISTCISNTYPPYQASLNNGIAISVFHPPCA